MSRNKNNENDNEFFHKNLKDSLNRYEEMQKKNNSAFFDTEELMDICDYYISNDEYQKSFDACKYAMGLYPNNTSFKLKEAAVLVKMGNYETALEKLKKFEVTNGNDSEMHIIYAHLYLSTGDSFNAVTHFKAALENAEDSAPIYHDLAFAFHDTGDYKNAIKYIELFIESGNGDYYTSLHYIQWLTLIDNLIRGQKLFEKIIDDNPYNMHAWLGKALIAKENLDYDNAIDALEFCMVIDENEIHVYQEFGHIFKAKEQYKDAIVYFEKAFKLDNENVSALYHIGDCYEYLDYFDKAREYYQQAIKINPYFADGWYSIGVILMHSDKWYEAIHYLKKAIEIEQENGEFWFALGDCEANLNHHNEAVECYENVIEMDPQNESIWIEYAMLLYDNNESLKAVEILHQGLKYHVDNAELFFHLCAMQYESGLLQEAYTTLADGLSIDYDLHAILFELIPGIKNDKNILRIIEQYKN
ncbi:MAG: tetratricopeptide repeat protein [Bacteroidetes bacterium]|nr:tetratricopeptide repeat protein [Bacteroidota bacterium]MBL0053616.1 tetratricopeptide repeat protein [Bacteroidota bacterium]